MTLIGDILTGFSEEGRLPAELHDRWRREGQRAWEEERNALSMLELCSYTDLVLGVNNLYDIVASRYVRSGTVLYSNAGGQDVIRWMDWGRLGRENKAWKWMEEPEAVRALTYAVGYAYDPYDAVAIMDAPIALTQDLVQQRDYDIILQVQPKAPVLTRCRECGEFAMMTGDFLSDFAHRNRTRTQVHWIRSIEEPCAPTRRVAEQVLAGFTPISFSTSDVVGGKRKTRKFTAGKGEESLWNLQEAAEKERASGPIKEAWRKASLVYSRGIPWRLA